MMKTSTVALLLLAVLCNLHATGASIGVVDSGSSLELEQDLSSTKSNFLNGLNQNHRALDDHDAHDGEDHTGHGHDDDDNVELSNANAESKPWGAAILASFLVNLCTLIGVLFLVPCNMLGRKASKGTKEYIFHIIIPSFACGALIATAVFLLIPEAIHLLSGGHDDHSDEGDDHSGHNHRMLEGDEADATWKFGTAVLGGYFLPFVFSGFFPHSHMPDEIPDEEESQPSTVDNVNGVAGKEVDDAEEEQPLKDVDPDVEKANNTDTTVEFNGEASEDLISTPPPKDNAPLDYRLASSILAGDFFHNFADGVFIGTAFLLCTRQLAIVVTATTVFHELSQELADFFLLTHQCRFPVWKALVVNFVSGLSVMLGVIVVFATNVSNEAIGVILSMSAGVYFYVALTECAPRINSFLSDYKRRATSFLFWVLGTIPIGLVLLNHTHC